MRLTEVRRALEGLERGRTTRIPDAVRKRVLAYAGEQRAAGRSWKAIGAELGVSASALQRWAKKAGLGPRGLARVRVVAEAAPAEEATVVLITPRGYRLEGLSVEQAVQALGTLG